MRTAHPVAGERPSSTTGQLCVTTQHGSARALEELQENDPEKVSTQREPGESSFGVGSGVHGGRKGAGRGGKGAHDGLPVVDIRVEVACLDICFSWCFWQKDTSGGGCGGREFSSAKLHPASAVRASTFTALVC